MSNILAEVIQTRDAVTGDEFRDLLQTVGNKLAQIKTDVVESLQSSFVLHDSDIDKVTSWYVEILGIQEKVENLQQKFQDDRKALKSAAEDIENLRGELEHCDEGVILLKSLCSVAKNLEKADSSDFHRASELVKTAREDLLSILDSFPSTEDHDWVVALRSHIADIVTDIYEKACKELRSVFQFQFGKNLLTISLTKDLHQIFEAFKNIGYVIRVANKLANDVCQELMVKACQQDYYIEVTGKPKRKGSKTHRGHAVIKMELVEESSTITIKAVKASVLTTQIEVVFTNIYNILTVFYDVFDGNTDIMRSFSDILGPKICEELGDKSRTLKNLIFRTAESDVEQARNNIAKMQAFISDFATQLNFVFPDNSVFDDLENDFDSLFLAQVKQDLLVTVRKLVKGNLHDTQEAPESDGIESSMPEDLAALHRNPYLFPKCVVSKCIVEMVEVVRNHMKRYMDDVTMCDAAFNLYLSLLKIPKHESESGDMAPFTAVLIHNNSLYLAHHAAFTFTMTEDKVPELRAKATQAYSFMLRSVRAKLNGMIADAMSAMLNNDDESSTEEVNKFLKIAAEFTRIHGMFEFVLPPATLNRTLATLVDHTVNEMCSKVLTWDDISAACASKLASAFTQFAIETSELFKGESTNPREIDALTAKAVSKWTRFRLLAFILTASMKEIEDKWVGGCGPLANEFKGEELRKLVRALFQNTDRRAAFLASIK